MASAIINLFSLSHVSSKDSKVRKRLQLNVSRPFEKGAHLAQQVSTVMHGAPSCMATMLPFTSHKTEPGFNHVPASCIRALNVFFFLSSKHVSFSPLSRIKEGGLNIKKEV